MNLKQIIKNLKLEMLIQKYKSLKIKANFLIKHLIKFLILIEQIKK